jgi:hypothetical protein
MHILELLFEAISPYLITYLLIIKKITKILNVLLILR